MAEKEKSRQAGNQAAGRLGEAANHTNQPDHSTLSGAFLGSISPNGSAASEPAPSSDTNPYEVLLEQGTVTLPADHNLPKPDAKEHADLLLSAGLSDEGNAQCIHRLYGGRFLWNEAFGWLCYTGTHWTTEGAEAALDRAVVQTLLERIKAASTPEQIEQQGALRKFCLPNKARVEGAKHLLRSLAYAHPSEFDAEPDRLNCLNGVVDLRSGELLPHSPEQRFLHCTAVPYKVGANWAVWEQWLSETVGKPEQTPEGKAEAVAWLQMAVGYSLTGHTREEVLFYLFGPPRSGKGVFIETLLFLLGEPLAKEVSFASFTAERTGDVQSFDLAPLKPCRFVAAAESNTYEKLNTAKVKAMTGGNSLYVAFKHKTPFNFRPQFKVWLSSNQPVNADPDDDAAWGRVRLLNFPNSHLGAEDKQLKQRFRSPAVIEGVLAWAVRGAMRWYALGRQGLSEPAGSLSLKAQQRDTLDAVGMWIDERCELGEHHFAAGSELYQDYAEWCKPEGVKPKQRRGLTETLQRKGYRYARVRQGDRLVRGFYGLKLVTL